MNLCDYPSDQAFYDKIAKVDTIRVATRQTYIHLLKRVTRITGKSLCASITSVDSTLRDLEKNIKSRASLKTVVASILAVLKWTGEKERNSPLFLQWYQKYQPFLKEAKEVRLSNIPSEKQLKDLIEWPQVEALLQSLSKTDFASESHLLIAMYAILCPRRQQDYFRVSFLRKLGDKVQEEDSYIDLISKQPYIMVKQFKTVGKYDTWRKELPAPLVAIIKQSLKTHPRDFLFVNSKGAPWDNRNSFTKWSNRKFSLLFQKPITVNSLRHAFSTYRNANRDLSLGERIEDAKAMGHSLETHLSYALKKKE